MADMLWVAGGYYVLAVGSAVLPFVNGELVMLSAIPLAGSRVQLAALVGVVTAGQMTGKALMYWIARRAARRPGSRCAALVGRWRARIPSAQASSLGVAFVSAVAGVPPFYLVTIAAGLLAVSFGRFLAVGALGRLLHFGIVAFIPHFVWSGF